jgi:hypothetical protein
MVKFIEIDIRARETITGNYFSFLPIVVQTAGTFTSTVDLSAGQVQEHLNSAIDDDFGYQIIGKQSCSKEISDSATGTYVQRRVVIPQNIIQLLNKEVGTERLQSLYFGIAGVQGATTGSFTMETQELTRYTLKKKGITIR